MTKKRAPKTSLWGKLPRWAWQQGLRSGIDWATNPDSRTSNTERTAPEPSLDIKTAQVITSRVEYPYATNMHKPVLDIDFPAQLVPSTTPGHFHLYLDREMEWSKYEALLHALADAGVIEDGYRWASVARGYTSVRLPWVRKEEQPPAPAPEEAPAAPAPQEAPQNLGEALLANAAQQRREADLRRLQQQDPIFDNLRQAYAQRPISQSFGTPQPAWQHPSARVRTNTAPNPSSPAYLRQQLMEAETRIMRQEQAQREENDAYYRRNIQLPPSQRDAYEWVGEPADANITVSWERGEAEAIDRLTAPQQAPPVADPNTPF